MSAAKVLELLREALADFRREEFREYGAKLERARREISALGDAPELLGEWKLVFSFSTGGDLNKVTPLLREAYGLLGGRSVVAERGMPMLFDYFDPFGCFFSRLGEADANVPKLEEAEGLWYRLTGGGGGTMLLYRARLSYFRCELDEARTLAVEAYRASAEQGQQMNRISAAEILGLLARHGYGGACTAAAMRYIRDVCEGTEEASLPCRQAAELVRSNLYLAMGILGETAEWIKSGDFGAVAREEHPGWYMPKGGLYPTLLPTAMLMRQEFLCYSGRYVEAIAVGDMATCVFHIDSPLVSIYFELWRGMCCGHLGDREGLEKHMRNVIRACAKDGLWLIPGENEWELPFLIRAAGEFGPEAAEKLRAAGCGLMDSIRPLREAYLRDRLPEGLTRREQQVMELVGAGDTNAQAARKLGVSEETVKTHLRHAFEKLNVNNRRQIAQNLGMLRKNLTAKWVK